MFRTQLNAKMITLRSTSGYSDLVRLKPIEARSRSGGREKLRIVRRRSFRINQHYQRRSWLRRMLMRRHDIAMVILYITQSYVHNKSRQPGAALDISHIRINKR